MTTNSSLWIGMAVRLSFDLGLHIDMTPYVTKGLMSSVEAEARKIAFWGCFVVDQYVWRSERDSEDLVLMLLQFVGVLPGKASLPHQQPQSVCENTSRPNPWSATVFKEHIRNGSVDYRACRSS
jgi:hypothetical protein